MTAEHYAIHGRLLVEETDQVLKFRAWRPYAAKTTIETCVINFPRTSKSGAVLTTISRALGGPGYELIMPRWLLEDRNLAGDHHGTVDSWHITTAPPGGIPRHPDILMGLMDQTAELIQENGRRDLVSHLNALSAELEQANALNAVGWRWEEPARSTVATQGSFAARMASAAPAAASEHPILIDGAACYYDGEREIAAGAWGLDENDPDLWQKVERAVLDQIARANAPEDDAQPSAEALDRAHRGRSRRY